MQTRPLSCVSLCLPGALTSARLLMSKHRTRPLTLIALAAAPLAHAQEIAPQPASPQACTSVTSDAVRLACYDKALGYTRSSPRRRMPQRNWPSRRKPSTTIRARSAGAAISSAPTDRTNQRRSGSKRGPRLVAGPTLGIGQGLQVRHFPGAWLQAGVPVAGVLDQRHQPHPQSPNPADSVDTPQPLDNTELKFQLSFKTKVVEDLFGDNGDIWMGYTQSSRWQAYNADASRPFRETNYEPGRCWCFATTTASSAGRAA